MRDYVLSCCSTVDLTHDFMVENDLHYICFHYFLNEVEYRDDFGQTIPLKEFYERMVAGEMTRTSQINIEEYADYFRSLVKEGKDVIHLTLSTGISGTYNSACIARDMVKEEYPDAKIEVIDSLAASSGYGLLMKTLADLKKNGASFDDVVKFANENKLYIHHWFFSSDLTFYIRGGRVSKASGYIANILHICPLLNVDYLGRLIVREKIVGKKKVINQMVKKMIEHAQGGVNYTGKVFMSCSACEEDARKVADLVEAAFPKMDGKVLINQIGTTIGSHTGPGTVALFFFGDKRVD